MHSSTFNSDRSLKNLSWYWVLCAPVLFTAVFIVWMEINLNKLGYHPTLHIPPNAWLINRAKANEYGTNALVFIGASRIELGIDLSVIKEKTPFKPVQLAIDSTFPHSALKGLAEDPHFTGTVIVDYYPLGIGAENALLEQLNSLFKKTTPSSTYVTSRDTETVLSRWLQSHLRVYADESTPYLSLMYRIITQKTSSQYIFNNLDRSRKADYSKVNKSDFYYSYLSRMLKIPVDIKDPHTKQLLESTVAAQQPKPVPAEWKQGIVKTNELIETIKKRGGNVIFVGMPTSGMVRNIDEKWYPKSEYWDYFSQHIHAVAVNANYVKDLNKFICPDGSHLDMKDQTAFTETLIAYLQQMNALSH